jgi:iron complex transport system permease protein
MAPSPAAGGDPAAAYRALVRRRLGLLCALGAVLAAMLLLDVLLGASRLSPSTLFDAVFDPAGASAVTRVIVWQIRLPQALMAVAVGMALGLAGAEMQTVLNNPLASPDTLGVSSAAAFGASLAIVLGVALPGLPAGWIVPANAFLFAFATALLLDGVARWRGMATSGVVLFGIALVLLFNALVSLVQFVASAEALQNLVFWTMGSLARADWVRLALVSTALAGALAFALRDSWRLTALRLGEDRAASFGVDVRRVRIGVLVRVSVLSGLAVSAVGVIGFIGLVGPHIARRLFGEDHRFLLCGSALTGGALLSAASVASKHVVPGLVIPVGIVTALIGIPFFLALVMRRQLP